MIFRNLLYSFLFLACSVNAQNQFNQNNILNAEEAFILNTQLTANVINASWQIAAEHYLYKDSIKVLINNEAIAHEFISLDESVINDEFFGESLVLQNMLVIRAAYNSNDLQNAIITIEYQGCAAGKYCYPKQQKNI
ncbi:protein-disulfide reductase DsbD family protein [Gammaproteobacteria bacterium]|nr:protein-disulfide reductase DsbD family protein [Gammaproteobacteria bacterium]